MKRLLLITLLLTTIMLSTAQAPALPPEKEFNFKFTFTEINWIARSVGTSEAMTAKQANDLVIKIQSQLADTTLNKK